MWNISQHNSSSSCSLVIGYSKNAAVVSKHFSLVGQYFRKYPSSIVVGLPYLILWAIDEDIFLDRMPVHVQKHYESVLKFSLQIYD